MIEQKVRRESEPGLSESIAIFPGYPVTGVLLDYAGVMELVESGLINNDVEEIIERAKSGSIFLWGVELDGGGEASLLLEFLLCRGIGEMEAVSYRWLKRQTKWKGRSMEVSIIDSEGTSLIADQVMFEWEEGGAKKRKVFRRERRVVEGMIHAVLEWLEGGRKS